MLRSLFGRGERSNSLEIDVARVAGDRTTKGLQIIDVREPDEWQSGHIPGAIHIPLGELGARFAEIDPERAIVTICRSGRRSLSAAKQLHKAGFGDVKSLAGGMLAWQRSTQPVER